MNLAPVICPHCQKAFDIDSAKVIEQLRADLGRMLDEVRRIEQLRPRRQGA